jgi:uroporphyrinogen-III decarboxylase
MSGEEFSETAIEALPEGFTAEAQALGAVVTKTSSGFETARYLYTNPDMLAAIPNISEQESIRKILSLIEKSRKKVLIKTSGPYSVLASLVEPSLFYRWLRKNPVEIHNALKKITAGLSAYITEAFARGALILSLADPFANPDVLGEKHYREFAAPYLLDLLRAAREKSQGVIHLCPHSSLPLEKFGYIESQTLSCANDSCINILLGLSQKSGLHITGHQCIYSGKTDTLHKLFLNSEFNHQPHEHHELDQE